MVNPIADALAQPFVWGAGGSRLTPDQVAREREIAAALLAQGADYSPVGHWLQGLARVANAGVGAFKEYQAGQAETAGRQGFADKFQGLVSSLSGGDQFPTAPVDPTQMAAAPTENDIANSRIAQAFGDSADLKTGIAATAQALGIDPIDLATAISYETAGTFDPTKAGPTTQWGQHKGLIQFGEPQAARYGVDWNNPLGSQLGPDGAIAKYLKDTGVQPGMGLMDVYSAINAGGVGRYNASDANNGGAPGTVADKVNKQMAGHRAKALALMGGDQPIAMPDGTIPAQAAPSGQAAIAQALTAGTPTQSAPVQQIAQALMPTDRNPMSGNVDVPMQSGPSMADLMTLAPDPWANDSQRAILGQILQQQMQANDPNAALENEYKRAQIDNMRSQINERNNPSARDLFGLNPQYGVDAQGNPVLLQVGKNGEAVQTKLPEGVSLSKEPIKLDAGTHFVLLDPITRQPVGQIAKNVAGEAAATEGGKAQGQAQAGLGSAEAGYQTAVEQIDAIMSHPGLNSSVGTIQGRIPDALAGAMNSDVADFRSRVGQLQGQTFLRAFEALKGGGAITEIEGKKAEQAIGRLNQAVSEEDFKTALGDLRGILDRGMEAYRRKAGASMPAPSNGDWQDLGNGIKLRVKP